VTEYVSASGIITLLAVCAGWLCLVTRWRRLGSICAGAAAVLYLLLASGPIAHALLGPLERQYPAVLDGGDEAIETLVVLTAYGRIDDGVPASSYVNAPSAFRIIEAARLLAGKPKRRIVISGGGGIPAAMKAVLLALGVPDEQVATESASMNTFESALHLRERLAGSRFYLVTSAGHMPRSMRVFRAQGLEPIPAPTDFLTKRGSRYWSGPSGQHLFMSDLAVHEYAGFLWYRITGRF
jgi:uncharacterized SAM-binding protein YcdF (DUF218 family)